MEPNDESRALWQAKAAWWDQLHADDGNLFHRTVVGPAVERLLALQSGERVIDVACGSGQLARRLATVGATVVATDGAAAFLALAEDRARRLPPEVQARLSWCVADATDEGALVALGDGNFDAAVCTMALMDIADIAPLHRAVARLLRPGGRFVVVVAHPAFNQASVVRQMQQIDRDGRLEQASSIVVTGYLSSATRRAVGAPDEPVPHLDFHRPLAQLLAPAFAAGLLLDGLEEPAFPAGVDGAAPLSWSSLPEFPPVLAYRLRKAAPA